MGGRAHPFQGQLHLRPRRDCLLQRANDEGRRGCPGILVAHRPLAEIRRASLAGLERERATLARWMARHRSPHAVDLARDVLLVMRGSYLVILVGLVRPGRKLRVHPNLSTQGDSVGSLVCKHKAARSKIRLNLWIFPFVTTPFCREPEPRSAFLLIYPCTRPFCVRKSRMP